MSKWIATGSGSSSSPQSNLPVEFKSLQHTAKWQVIESTKIYLLLAVSAADPLLMQVLLAKVKLVRYLSACSYRQGRHVVVELVEQVEGNMRLNAAAVQRRFLSAVAHDLPQVLAES
jgi:hypothetical protein